MVHPSHYAVFWALEATAKRLSSESAGGGGGRRERIACAAEEAWTRFVSLGALCTFVCACMRVCWTCGIRS